jgi:molecular chaperone HscB
MRFRLNFGHCLSIFNMQYFELFQMPVQVQVDQQQLKKQFHQLSRSFHPDNFSQSDDLEQQAVLEKYSLVNQAYKTLSSPDETLRYILTEKGLMTDESLFKLPPDFLMEMMELNEELGENEEAIAKVEAFRNALYNPIQNLIAHYDDTKITNNELQLLKEYYFKKKYLDRILARTK